MVTIAEVKQIKFKQIKTKYIILPNDLIIYYN